MKKPIYCNCGTYLGERDGFDIIRCKKCGIDYVVKSEKGFWDYYKSHKLAIHVSEQQECENLITAIANKFNDKDYKIFYKYTEDTCVYIKEYTNLERYMWNYASKSFCEKEGYTVIQYKDVKDLIEKELDR